MMEFVLMHQFWSSLALVIIMSAILFVRFILGSDDPVFERRSFEKIFFCFTSIAFMPGGAMILVKDRQYWKGNSTRMIFSIIGIVLFLCGYVIISYLLFTWIWIALLVWIFGLLLVNFFTWMMK